MILGLITARGDSKRVPRKNSKDFLGKPLVAWTIDVAKRSGVLDRIVLSTEDAEIARIGRRAGAEVLFMRPAELASDTAGSLEVVLHAVRWLKEHEQYEAPWIMLLEPTSPGRQAGHLIEVAGLLRNDFPFDSVLGIAETPGHWSPLKALVRDADGTVTRYGDREIIRNLTHRSQDIAKTYHTNSALYAFRTKNLFTDPPSLWGERTHGYLMSNDFSFDIDTPDDWILAEIKMKTLLDRERVLEP